MGPAETVHGDHDPAAPAVANRPGQTRPAEPTTGSAVYEIRIHGVSGTPPGAMLFRDADGKVTRTRSYTDSLTGFFADADADADPDRPVRVEAYSWGGLTSSAGQMVEKVKRIGWLMLIPFALANLAYWARPDIDKATRPERTVGRHLTAIAVRWAGLLLTVIAVATACVLAMDLVAWQCFRGGALVCSLPGWLPAGPLELLGREGGNAAPQRLATAAVVPMAAIVVLFFLSARSRRRYESVASDDPVVGCRDHPGHWGPRENQDGDILLRRNRMWLGSQRILRQQLNHFAAAVAVIVVYLTMPVLPAVDAFDAGRWLRLVAFGAALAVVCAFTSAALSVRDGNEFCGVPDGRRERTARWLALLGATVAVACLLAAIYLNHGPLAEAPVDQSRDFLADTLWSGTDSGLLLTIPFMLLSGLVLLLMFASRSWRASVGILTGFALVVALAFITSTRTDGLGLAAWLVVAVAIVLAVGVVAWQHRRVGGPELQAGRAWRGAAPALVLGAGVWVALLFTLSVLVGAAAVLNGEQPVSAIRATSAAAESVAAADEIALVLPAGLLWAVTLLPLWVALVLGCFLVAYCRFRRTATTIEQQIRRDIRDLGGIELDDEPRCVRGRRMAAFAHRAERLAGLAAAVTATLFLVLIAGSATGDLPWDIWDRLRYVGDAGLYLSLGVSLALVWFLSQVRTSDDARRQAGVVWDIATFLPRVAHPLGPPSYGERVVPEVTRRVRALLDAPAGHVVILSGHSQGSVIAVAVATRLRDDQLERLRVVTYGSQLRAWFGRVFPSVLGPAQLGTGPLPHSWGFDQAAPDAYPETPADEPGVPPPPGTLAGKLGPEHWVNLFRRSDPIGFRVFADLDGAPASPDAAVRPRDVYVPEIDDRYDRSTHSGYQFTPAYRQIVACWATGDREP